MKRLDDAPEPAPAEPKGWQRHADPRDRRQDPDGYDATAPWLEQGRGPPGHNY